MFDNVTDNKANNRHISFVVDCDGVAGKLFLINCFMSALPKVIQSWTVRTGKAADLACDLGVNTKYIFLLYLTRGLNFLTAAFLRC